MDDQRVIDEAWNGGFEAGVAYVFGHIPEGALTLVDVNRFISWIELKCSWKTADEWRELIMKRYHRMTRGVYEDCKRVYAENRVKYADEPGILELVDQQEQELEKHWQRIVEAGFEKG